MKLITKILGCFLSSLLVTANLSAQTIDAGTLPVNGGVYAMAEDANYIYVGGDFNRAGGNVTHGEAIDLATQQPLNLPAVNGEVKACIGDGNGGWYIGGSFTSIGGVARQGVAHILPDKTLNQNWNANIDVVNSALGYGAGVYNLVLSGTNLYLIGNFQDALAGQTRRLVRVSTTTGQIDAGWNPNPNNGVSKILFAGTHILVCGNFNEIGGFARNGIAKINTTTGQADINWNVGLGQGSQVYNMLLSGNNLYMAGYFYGLGQSTKYLLKVNNDGIIDTTWNPTPNSQVTQMELVGTDLLVGGSFNAISGITRNGLAKIKPDGTVDSQWNPNLTGQNEYVAINKIQVSGNDLYVCGIFSKVGTVDTKNIAKISLDGTGTLNSSWSTAFVSSEMNNFVLLNNDLYISAKISWNSGTIALKANATTGAVDNTWDIGIGNVGIYGYANNINTMFLQNNSLYVGGTFASIGGHKCNNLVRFNKNNNTLDMTWNPNVVGKVQTLHIEAGSLYVGGNFTQVGGAIRNSLAKVSTTGAGALDTQWNPNITVTFPNPTTTTNGYIGSIVSDGNYLYAGGYFDKVGTTSLKNLAKISLTGTGTPENVWTPNPNDSVRGLIINNEKLFLHGIFSTVGGQARNSLAKISTTGQGTVDASWNPNNNNLFITSMALSGDYLYVGLYNWNQQNIGGQYKNGVAKLSIDGAGEADASWALTSQQITPYYLLPHGNNLFLFYESKVGKADLNTGFVTSWELIENSGSHAYVAYINSNTTGKVIGNDLYIYGAFSKINSETRAGLAKLSGQASLPTITSTSNLAGFETITTQASASKNFQVSGIGFTSNIALSVNQTDWELSTDNATWNTTLSLTPNAGAVSQTVYVRLKAGLTLGNKTAQISITTTGMSATVTLQGQVKEPTWEISATGYFRAYTTVPSESGYVTITGLGFSDNINISLSNADWEVAQVVPNVAPVWSASLSLPTASGATNSITFRIRLKQNSVAGIKTTVLTASSAGFTNKSITLQGEVLLPYFNVYTFHLTNFQATNVAPSFAQMLHIGSIAVNNQINLAFSTTDWEMSFDNQNWATSLAYVPTLSVYYTESKLVYVRLKAGLTAGTKTAQMTISSTGATSNVVNLSGEVTNVGGITLSAYVLEDFNTTTVAPSDGKTVVVNAVALTNNVVVSLSNNDWEILGANGWVSSISIQPNSNNLIENYQLYVRLKAGLTTGNKSANLTFVSTGVPTKTVALSGAVNGSFIPSTANLKDFITNTTQPSSSKTVVISNSNLAYNVAMNVSSDDWEMSINGTNWSDELVFTPASWTTNTKTIYVRLKAGLTIGNKAGTLTITTLGVYPHNIALTGKVINGPVASLSTDMLQSFQANPSASSTNQTFTVYGTGFTANLQASVSTTDWELSTDNNTWANTLQILPTNGKVDYQKVYVRLKKGLTQGIKTATLTISSPDIESQFIALRGEVIEPTAVLPTLKTEVAVYPNPSNTGKFYVKVGELNADKLQITVINQQGKTIYQIEATHQNETMIDLPTLPKGLYLLRIDVGKGSITKKIIRN